jgi:hypothetical protein
MAYAIGMSSLFTVVEHAAFIARADKLLTAEEHAAVVGILAETPECGDLIPGTGGVRKVRIALPGRGKSGGARVIYFFYNETMPVHALAIFAKNEKANLTTAEKNNMKKLVDVLVRDHKAKRGKE